MFLIDKLVVLDFVRKGCRFAANCGADDGHAIHRSQVFLESTGVIA